MYNTGIAELRAGLPDHRVKTIPAQRHTSRMTLTSRRRKWHSNAINNADVRTDIERFWRFFSKQVETLLHSSTVIRRTQILVTFTQLSADVIQSYVLRSVALYTPSLTSSASLTPQTSWSHHSLQLHHSIAKLCMSDYVAHRTPHAQRGNYEFRRVSTAQGWNVMT